MSTLADRVVAIARSQVGVHEDGVVANDGEPSRAYAGGRREPWCGHFCAWVFREAGRALPGDEVPTLKRGNPIAGVACMENLCRMQGWRVLVPAPGDIVFFANRGASDRGPGRHVGIIELADMLHLTQTIEANVPDVVKRIRYRRTTLERLVTTYCRVPDLEGSK